MPTNETVLQEARELGLDVEAERADFDQLRADVPLLQALADEVRKFAVEWMNDGRPLVLGDVNRLPRKVDLSSRAAALDRIARLGVVSTFLRELEGFGQLDAGYPPWRDDSDTAELTRRELDWLGFLPGGMNVDDSDFDPIGEENALFEAIFAHDIPDADGEGDPEFEIVKARQQAAAARLLLRISEHPDWLRERAMELLHQADEGMEGASDAMAALQDIFDQRRREKGGDDDA